MTVPAPDIPSTATIQRVFDQQKERALTLRKETWHLRRDRLKKLRDWIHRNRKAIGEAAYNDFRKPAGEFDAIEIFHVLNEIRVARHSLRHWTRAVKVDAPLTMLGTRSWIQYEPKGTCLILSPWNYPFALTVGPLVSAIAAGNTAILKPSEYTPHMSAVVKRMVSENFRENEVALFEGSVSLATELLTLPFDHIFFTGSPAVGKVVMRAASETLASVTLELGGKSPCIVTRHANLDDAAERIAVAKFVNNGQTCIAPDYVLVERSISQTLIRKLIDKTKSLFSRNSDFSSSTDYCRIISEKHFDRLSGLVADAIVKGAKVESDGINNREDRFFHPVVLSEVPNHAAIMEEEIFGPVLPVIAYDQLEEAISFVYQRPKPLALYLFSDRKTEQRRVLQETSSGGVCINDCAIHFLHHRLPFGGVNNSGTGRSHGYAGFLAFSNEKAVLKQKGGFTSVKVFYPPYSRTRRLVDWFLKFF